MAGHASAQTTNDRVRVIVDAHVHVHDCYDVAEFLDSAHSNFEDAMGAAAGPASFAGVLLLTETAGTDYFSRLASGSAQTSAWHIHGTGESCSLIAESQDKRLAIVAGRQVAGAEDLEVLMLGTNARVEDGRPIRDLLEVGERLGAVRVVPWGPGKWFFSRGKLVGEILRGMEGREFFLGDEGGRPVFWPTPTRFADAARLGVRVLRGTDPLPFPWEVGRVATFGFRVTGAFDWSHPWASLRPLLSDPGVTLEPYGRLERPVRFFRNQYGMQMRKRRRPR
jgi:hypothetical protein